MESAGVRCDGERAKRVIFLFQSAAPSQMELFDYKTEFSYNVAQDGVHIRGLHATSLYLLGTDHERLTFKYQGRSFRLIDVHGHGVKPLLG